MPHAHYLTHQSSQTTNSMPPPPRSLPGLSLNKQEPEESCLNSVPALQCLSLQPRAFFVSRRQVWTNPKIFTSGACLVHLLPVLGFPGRAQCPCKQQRQQEKSQSSVDCKQTCSRDEVQEEIWSELKPCKVYSGKKNYLQGLRNCKDGC